MPKAAKSRRHIVHYRLRRLASTGWIREAAADRPEDIAHFIYDFDNDVLATDKPRKRFTSLTTVLRRPRLLGGTPRPGRWNWWPFTKRVFSERLNFGQDGEADSLLLERLGKKGWNPRGTLHVTAKAAAYVNGFEYKEHAEICPSFSVALSRALLHEKYSVREFLWGFREAIFMSIVVTVFVTAVALLFPIVSAFAISVLPTASDGTIPWTTTVFATLVSVAAAYFFFRLRTHSQALYGAIELGVGLGMAIASIRNAYVGARFDFALKTMASVYVMIRGMANLKEYSTKKGASKRDFLSRTAVERHAEILDQLRAPIPTAQRSRS